MDAAKVRSEFDEKMMRYALELADKAEALGEIPVGAVLVDDARNYWRRLESLHCSK